MSTVHTRQQIVAENGNKLLPENGKIVAVPVKVAVSGNNSLPFSATLLPGVDRPLVYSDCQHSVSDERRCVDQRRMRTVYLLLIRVSSADLCRRKWPCSVIRVSVSTKLIGRQLTWPVKSSRSSSPKDIRGCLAAPNLPLQYIRLRGGLYVRHDRGPQKPPFGKVSFKIREVVVAFAWCWVCDIARFPCDGWACCCHMRIPGRGNRGGAIPPRIEH